MELTSAFGDVITAGFESIVRGRYDQASPVYSTFMNEVQMRFPTYKTSSVTGLSLPSKKTEGAAVSYQDASQGYNKELTPNVYASGIQFSQELVEDDLYDVVGKKQGKDLADAFIASLDIDCAGLFINATATTYDTCGDGLALASTVHTLAKVGGTDSNLLSADLSVTSLWELINMLETTKLNNGRYGQFTAKYLVVSGVAPENERIARQLLGSDKNPEDNKNAINVIRSRNLQLIVWKELTDLDAFYVLADNHDLMLPWKRKLKFSNEIDFDSGNLKIKASYRYARGFNDFRGFSMSEGA